MRSHPRGTVSPLPTPAHQQCMQAGPAADSQGGGAAGGTLSALLLLGPPLDAFVCWPPHPSADLLVPGRVANVGTYPSAVAVALITVMPRGKGGGGICFNSAGRGLLTLPGSCPPSAPPGLEGLPPGWAPRLSIPHTSSHTLSFPPHPPHPLSQAFTDDGGQGVAPAAHLNSTCLNADAQLCSDCAQPNCFTWYFVSGCGWVVRVGGKGRAAASVHVACPANGDPLALFFKPVVSRDQGSSTSSQTLVPARLPGGNLQGTRRPQPDLRRQ